MTILAIIALVAALCLISWLLNQWPVFWRRLALVTVLWAIGSAVEWQAEKMGVLNETILAVLTAAASLFVLAAAAFLVQPLARGMREFLEFVAELDEANGTEVQP